MRIVVVEDEENMRNSLVKLIQSIDPEYRVVATASNGEEGLAVIRKTKPTVVFTDIRMPKMNGLEMIELLLQEKIKAHYVIISAYSDFEYAQRGIRFGIRDYLLKPISYAEIERILRLLNTQKRAQFYTPESIEDRFPIPAEASPIVKRAVEFIHKNYSQPISMEELAKSFGVTHEYFSRIFSQDMGIGFTAYLKQYRVWIAQELLMTQKYSVQDVGDMVGYSNSNYFGKVFKDITGYGPSSFCRIMQSQRSDLFDDGQ